MHGQKIGNYLCTKVDYSYIVTTADMTKGDFWYILNAKKENKLLCRHVNQ